MRKINWGVLGTANIARKHTIPGMVLADNCRLYAIAGRNMEKAEAFRVAFGFEKAYGSYEALLADPQVEAVYIPLPNELHYEWAIRAMKAGKHVLCEKPLAPTAELAAEMIQTANENHVILMEAFAYLHSPLTAAIKQELESGTIGDTVYMESTFITSDYDISNIRMRKETFGGCTYDLGCYNIGQILWMLGQEPETVQALASFSGQGIDIYTSGLMTFSGNRRAAFTCGMNLATEKGDRIDRVHIFGTEGSIYSDAEFNQDGELTYTVKTKEGTFVKTVHAPQNYALEIEQLGRCITDGETPHVSNEFTLAVSRTTDRVLQIIGY